MNLETLKEIERHIASAHIQLQQAHEVLTGRNTHPLYDFDPVGPTSLPEIHIALSIQQLQVLIFGLEAYLDELQQYHPANS